MAARRVVYAASVAGSNSNTVLLQSPNSLFLSGSSPSFLGSSSMVSFKDGNLGKRSERSFFCSFDQEDNEDDELDEYFQQPEKKRRLMPDQVQFLERNFEADNKLEPERKIQLAKDLGLQPRQVAIWFQNRRARWKTKHLEKDYEALQASYNSLKADYDGLVKEKDKLKAKVLHLTDELLTKNQSEAPLQELTADSVSEDEVSKISIAACKQDDLTSAKSDELDSGSPCHVDGSHSSLLEPGDSSYVFEPDQSDLSQDEEDHFCKNLLPPPAYLYPKIDDAGYPDPSANPCYFGFPVEDHTFEFWSN
ncbi:unnamed protein product [Camellia sinensis]